MHSLTRGLYRALPALAGIRGYIFRSFSLVEGGPSDRVDRILVVDVDEAVQLRRVMERDGCTAEQAHAILASQASRSARLAAADDVLQNAGTVTDLRQAVDRLHARYLRLAEIQGSGA